MTGSPVCVCGNSCIITLVVVLAWRLDSWFVCSVEYMHVVCHVVTVTKYGCDLPHPHCTTLPYPYTQQNAYFPPVGQHCQT